MSGTVELRACEEEDRVAFYGRRVGGPWRLLAFDRHGRLVLARDGAELTRLGITSAGLTDLVAAAEHMRPGGRSPEQVMLVEGVEPRRPVEPPNAGRVLGEIAAFTVLGLLVCAAAGAL